jgi:hypothetical protein
MKEATIPADLLELKARLGAWRDGRRHRREPIPDDLRQAVIEISRRYLPSLVRRTLKLDPRRLKTGPAKKPGQSRHQPQTAFFKLPPEVARTELGSAAPPNHGDCRLQGPGAAPGPTRRPEAAARAGG